MFSTDVIAEQEGRMEHILYILCSLMPSLHKFHAVGTQWWLSHPSNFIFYLHIYVTHFMTVHVLCLHRKCPCIFHSGLY